MKRTLWFFLIILGGNLALAASWETLPPDHWAYPEIRWLQVEGYLQSLDPTQTPYRRGEIASALQAGQRPDGGMALARYQQLEDEFAPETVPQPGWKATLGGRLFAGFEADFRQPSREAGYGSIVYKAGNPRYGIYGALRGDRDLSENPYYTGKKWNDWSGFTEAAYIVFTARRWELKVGRDHVAWGPGDDHLLLNDGPRGLDQISLQARWKWGRFSAIIGQVSDDLDSLGMRTSRFLSGHRLEITPWSWLRIGLSETLLFSSFRLGSFNPFLPYYAELVNENSEGNGMLGLDVTAFPWRGWQAYAEFLLDDLQLEEKKPEDLEPTEWGWLIGLRWAGLDGALAAGISYEGVTNRTYNALEPYYRYINYGLPLGSDLGNDADRLRLELSCWPDAKLRLDGFFQYQRQGEGSLYAPFDTSYASYTLEQGYDEPFPTGVVQTTSTLGAGFTALAHPNVQAVALVGYDWIRNAGHVSGWKDEGFWGRAVVVVRLEEVVGF